MRKRTKVRMLTGMFATILATTLLFDTVFADTALIEDSVTADTEVMYELSDQEGPAADTLVENDGAEALTEESPAEESPQAPVEDPDDEVPGIEQTIIEIPDINYTTYDYLLGGWIWKESVENEYFDQFYPKPRKETPIYSQKGIVSCSKKKFFVEDKNCNEVCYVFKGVKPGTTKVSFKITYKGGSEYDSEGLILHVYKPELTQTKFNVTSLKSTINMNDYISGLEGYNGSVTTTWTSSKPTVAAVDSSSGLVTMNSAGTTKITGEFYDTQCLGKVKVTATVNVKVPKMNKTSVTLIPGQKVKITLGNMPKGKIVDEWNLSSWGYKVRDDGYRLGLEETHKGNTCEISAFMECSGTITATVDGDTYTCDINVTAPKIKNTQMTLKKGKSGKISISGTKFKPNVFSYVSGDPGVAIVDESGKVTAVGSGTAYIDVYLFQTRACTREEIASGGGRVLVIVP